MALLLAMANTIRRKAHFEKAQSKINRKLRVKNLCCNIFVVFLKCTLEKGFGGFQQWDPALAEQLDRDFQHASSSTAKSVCRKPHVPYVTKLAKSRKERIVLKQVLSLHRTGIDLSSSIAHQV